MCCGAFAHNKIVFFFPFHTIFGRHFLYLKYSHIWLYLVYILSNKQKRLKTKKKEAGKVCDNNKINFGQNPWIFLYFSSFLISFRTFQSIEKRKYIRIHMYTHIELRIPYKLIRYHDYSVLSRWHKFHVQQMWNCCDYLVFSFYVNLHIHSHAIQCSILHTDV